MHPNEQLLQKLFTSLNNHQPESMMDCYHADATFRDIAFDLKGKDEIRPMWEMVCNGDIRATFTILGTDDNNGAVKVMDNYTFSETGRHVLNSIDSSFKFKDGLIIEQHDDCDARAWAAAALGGVAGFLGGRIRVLRTFKANAIVRNFTKEQGERRKSQAA